MATESVYTGRWTDHSQNDILGGRVTMSTKSATILVAFIALFDGLVGNVFWNLLSFLIHQYRAGDDRPRDGLFHQLQVLLRNSNESFAFAQNALIGGWRWRKRAPRALARTVSLSLIAISVSLFFSAAGVLSSLIVSSGSVLLTGANCGFFNPVQTDFVMDVINAVEASNQGAVLLHGSIEYAKSCYNNPFVNTTKAAAMGITPNSDCNFFVKPSLDWTTTIGTSCPFSDPSVCSVAESEIIRMDTGYVDSHDDLGINGKSSDRVQFRRITTCSPITTNGFSNNSFVQTGFPDPFSDVVTYSYGYSWAQQLSRQNISSEDSRSIAMWLMENNVTFAYQKAAFDAVDGPYFVTAKSVLLDNDYIPERFFVPVARISEDPLLPVSIIFLANHALYVGQNVTDPWMGASEMSVQCQGNSCLPTYYTSTPGSVMGCLEQYQICNPSGTERVCSDLNSTWNQASPFASIEGGPSYELSHEFYEPLGMNLVQQRVATNILKLLQITSIPWVVGQAGAESLLASNTIFNPQAPFSPPLPSNQWQVEVEHWQAISNAWLQRYILQGITGPTEASIQQYWQLTSDPATAILTNNSAVYAIDKHLCSSQKVKSTAFQSFSVLGLAINFTIGGVLLFAGIIVRYCKPTFGKQGELLPMKVNNRHDAWVVDGNLQLQRMAYEQLGLGSWSGADDSVPLTKKGDLFLQPRIVAQDGVETIQVVEVPSNSMTSLPDTYRHNKDLRSEIGDTLHSKNSSSTMDITKEDSLRTPYIDITDVSEDTDRLELMPLYHRS